MIRNIIEVDVEYPKHLHDLHNNLPFLPERMKIKNCNKLVCSFYDKNNYAVFGKNIENVRKHRDIKLVTINRRKKYLVSEPNYYTKNLLAIEMKKIKLKMNNPVYFGLSILEISKILMYEFWYDYIKSKYQ